jgi:hypothetical protein
MSDDPLSQEQLRELARRIRSQLPDGVFYALVVWPPGQPEDCGYFSNAQRVESVIAIETILGHGLGA